MFPKVNLSASLNDWGAEIKPTLFDIGHNVDHKSAIDLFLAQQRDLNKLILDPTGKINAIDQLIKKGELEEIQGRKVLALLSQPNDNSKLYNLILLGYISAVEAYFRKLIREIINIDRVAREKCQMKTINFGATYYQDKDKYPESLMEGISFASSKNILTCIRELLGVVIQPNKDSSLGITLMHFDSLCQLRHCIIHRFGNIGVNNIIQLGIHGIDYQNCIEKPISLNYQSIQKASKVTSNLVREINHEVWSLIMERLANETPNFWKWDLRIDRTKFIQYLSIFFETDKQNLNDSYKEIFYQYKKMNK